MTIINPADVLRQHGDLRDHFLDPQFIKLVFTQFSDTLKAPEGGDKVFRSMAGYLDRSKSYRVEQQMTDVIMNRARSYDDNHTTIEPPTPFGFCVLEEPIRIIDTHGREEIIHAINWAPMMLNFQNGAPSKPSVLVATWNDVYREPDQVWREDIEGLRHEPDTAAFIRHSGRWSLVAARPIPFEWPMGPFDLNESANRFAELNYPDGVKLVPDEVPIEIAHNGKESSQSSFNVLRVLSALFEMLGERVPASKSENAELTRVEKKQAKREGLAPEVILVTLRPEYDPTHHEYRTGTGRTQKVRSKLGNPEIEGDIAYWRTIHRGTPRERKVPVRAHYRGPEDGPAPTPKVYNLGR